MIRVDARPMDYASGIREGQDKKAEPQEQKEEKALRNSGRKPDLDQYIPEKAGDSLEEDKNKVGEPEKKPDNDGLKNKDSGPKTEKCTGNTDKVDREIEKLKKRKKELEIQLLTEEDAGKSISLEVELAQVERELSQKDNDAYRRQHTVFS